MNNPGEKGFSVVEIVVAAAIIVTVTTAAAGAWQLYLRLASSTGQKDQAALMTEEAGEILRLFRDQSWSGDIAPLANGTTYYLYWNGTQYATSTAVQTQNGLERTVVLSAVSRDAGTFNIVSSGGTVDTNTRMATITVSPSGGSPLLTSEMLIHNVYAN